MTYLGTLKKRAKAIQTIITHIKNLNHDREVIKKHKYTIQKGNYDKDAVQEVMQYYDKSLTTSQAILKNAILDYEVLAREYKLQSQLIGETNETLKLLIKSSIRDLEKENQIIEKAIEEETSEKILLIELATLLQEAVTGKLSASEQARVQELKKSIGKLDAKLDIDLKKVNLVKKKEASLPFQLGKSIKIEGEVKFVSGSYNIIRSSIKALSQIISILKNYPRLIITVSAHSSGVGSQRMNQLVSEQRAATIRDYIVEKGIDPARVFSSGFGNAEPIATNKTPQGRNKNRRIEFIATAFKQK